MAQTLALFNLVALILLRVGQAWIPDGEPILGRTDLPTKKFEGNTTAKDFFRLLDRDDESILIGARNVIYNLTIDDLKENVHQRIEWHSTGAHRELCALKGKSPEEDCQNYLRVSARADAGKILVCGTNSYKPQCRHYHPRASDGRLGKYEEFDGTGLCPYDPEHNSTALYTDSQLYTATVADFSASDPLIYRGSQRTEQSDLRQLNNPSFVSSVRHGEYAFFFFRETAVEFMNCGKAVYSRVARVCLNDKGGSRNFAERWTTFLKARLNCSIQGEYPFYFDEIQSTTGVVSGLYGRDSIASDIIYGVLTTPVNSIGGSAVCAFSMRDILAAFKSGFKAQESINSNWLPVEEDKIPKQRPGKCLKDSRTLPDETINFVKAHSLMEQAVPSFLSKPLLIRVSLHYRFSAIAVYPQALSTNGRRYDILYIGTDTGMIIKTLNAASALGDFDNSVDEDSRAPVDTVVISEQQVLDLGVPIKQLHISVSKEKLIIISNEIIRSIPLNHCSNITSCSSCVLIRDPHCAWKISNNKGSCEWVGNRHQVNPAQYLQDVEYGKAEICNKLPLSYEQPMKTRGRLDVLAKEPQSEMDKTNDFSNEISIQIPKSDDFIDDIGNDIKHKHETGPFKINSEENVIYTAKSLYIIVVAACLVTLLIGFIVGYLFSRRFRHPFFSETAPFHEQHNHLNSCVLYRLPPLETPLNANPTAYLPRRANKTINLVVNVPMKQDNLQHELDSKDRTHECKNSNESLDKDIKCGTLQKVKKTYI